MKHFLLNNPKTTLFCLGCLSALAMAPVYAWPLMMVGYCALLWFLTNIQQNWKQTALYVFVFFFGYFATSLYWISSSLFVEIDKWWWALPFSFAGLPFLLALFPCIIITILTRINKFKPYLIILGLIITDLARGHLFTGFPWNVPAHTWAQTDVIMSTLPYIGLWGLNSVTIALFCLPFLLPRNLMVIPVIGLILVTFIPTNKPISHDLPDNIVMIQANIPQHEKWDPQLIWRNFDRYVEMTQDEIDFSRPQIIIWPETAISQHFINAPAPRAEFKNFLSTLPKESLLITGYLNYKDDMAYNSVAVFNREGEIIHQYDKHHLVPFGEYMPFGLDTITGFSNFSAGTRPNNMNIESLTLNLLPIICYESIFPQYFAPKKDDAIILNLTNDSWFGRTAGPYQHLDHILFRAYETQSPAIRLSGNGISAIINKNGQIVTLSKLNSKAVLKSKSQI